MSAINPLTSSSYVSPLANPSTATSTSDTSNSSNSPTFQDEVQLSLAGRIAIGLNDGRLTSDQAQQLNSQLNSIKEAIQNGGSKIGQMESQLSQTIYSDAHNGAAMPAGLTPTLAQERESVQAGRIVTQENAGNLTNTQASQLFGQMNQIYQLSQNGASASAVNQAQDQLSAEIFNDAHGSSNSSSS